MSDSTGKQGARGERPGAPRQWVEDLNEGEAVSEFFAVRKAPEKMGGSKGVRVLVGDFADLTLFTWSRGGELRAAAAEPGTVVHVEGDYAFHPKYKGQIEIKSIRTAEPGEYDPAQLYPTFDEPRSELERRRDALIAGMDQARSSHLVQLLDRLIVSGSTAEMWCSVPAPTLREKEDLGEDEARDWDNVYGCRHGLFALAVKSGEAALAMAHLHGWPIDLAVTCALLKHVGMVEALEALEIGFQVTAEGRLEKSPMLGYSLVRRTIEEIEGFPEEAARALRHALLANAKGTAVNPLIRVVSGISSLVDFTLEQGNFGALERDADPDAVWSSFSEAIGGQVYLGDRSA